MSQRISRRAGKSAGIDPGGRSAAREPEVTAALDEAADLRRTIAELRAQLDAAQAREAATAEVLQVINSSPGELAPVFDAMLEKALHLCGAAFGILHLYDGADIRTVAHRGLSPDYAQFLSGTPHRPGTSGPLAAFLRGEPFVHWDAAESQSYREGHPLARALVEMEGGRTLLAVPLRKDAAVVGMFVVYRREVRPFGDKQITLLQNFAAQAVIAIENARLLAELQERTRDLEESLEYQTATSDVLNVISRSTFDLQPVLDTLVATAVRLCSSDTASVIMLEGDVYRYVSGYGHADEYWEILRERRVSPGREGITQRVLLEHRIIHVPDVTVDPEFKLTVAISMGGARSILGVPLLREGAVVGVISMTRRRVEPFTERQIELVRTFADQAVIAIENARLLTELQERTRDLEESLEYQTATSDVLKVISRSTFDLQPVLDTLVETAARLCGRDTASIILREGKVFRYLSGHGHNDEYWEILRQRMVVPGREGITARVALEGRTVHVADIAADPEYALPTAITVAGQRTVLGVPLLRDGAVVGVISMTRRRVEPFIERQIELVRTFADQAVIAIENTRLLAELRERQQELRATFENMGDGVAMFDEAQTLVAWNHKFQEILDLPDDIFAQRLSYPDFVGYLAERGEYGDDSEEHVRRLTERAGHFRAYERTRPDGRVIGIRHNPVPEGGFVVIYADITERKRSEEAVRAARDTAEQALGELRAAQASLIQAEKMASLGQLTAGIAHEIKNPLNFVNNFAGLSIELLDELTEVAAPGIATLDDDTRAEIDDTIAMLTGNLDKIAEHGRRADNIVKSMLEHSRGVSGERREVDLNALVDEALNLAYHGARAQDQSFNITLERDLDPAMAPVELAPQEMTRVLLNLIGNGFYATAERRRGVADTAYSPALKVATRDLGAAVEIRVRDNGMGIAPEIRDKLFQPFFTTKPTGEGTGLGLSISWDIVAQQHGGMIAVDSQPGEFTEFTIRLPRPPA
jgi:two-component system NtrC family sensor kinase